MSFRPYGLLATLWPNKMSSTGWEILDKLPNIRRWPSVSSLAVNNIYVYSHIWSIVLVVAIENLVWWSTDTLTVNPRASMNLERHWRCTLFQILRKIKYPSVAGPAHECSANPSTCFDGAPTKRYLSANPRWVRKTIKTQPGCHSSSTLLPWLKWLQIRSMRRALVTCNFFVLLRES